MICGDSWRKRLSGWCEKKKKCKKKCLDYVRPLGRTLLGEKVLED